MTQTAFGWKVGEPAYRIPVKGPHSPVIMLGFRKE